MKCKQWEIWDANVKFDDSDEIKKRPVLVIDAESGIAIALKMTTHPPRDDNEYILKDWEKSGLKKPTTIRTSKVLHLLDSDIIKKRGSLTLKDRVAFTTLNKSK